MSSSTRKQLVGGLRSVWKRSRGRAAALACAPTNTGARRRTCCILYSNAPPARSAIAGSTAVTVRHISLLRFIGPPSARCGARRGRIVDVPVRRRQLDALQNELLLSVTSLASLPCEKRYRFSLLPDDETSQTRTILVTSSQPIRSALYSHLRSPFVR